jgi:hypothetical protein
MFLNSNTGSNIVFASNVATYSSNAIDMSTSNWNYGSNTASYSSNTLNQCTSNWNYASNTAFNAI